LTIAEKPNLVNGEGVARRSKPTLHPPLCKHSHRQVGKILVGLDGKLNGGFLRLLRKGQVT